MEGYVNVDLDERKDVDYQYVKSDIKSLPFDSNTVEEILTVHVIEHIWLWELQDCLKEWLRVLRPQGKLIIECPDIIKACGLIIGGFKNARPDAINAGMAAIYGDPRDRDLPGRHKWGWTPKTMKHALKLAGFADIQERPAEYHFKDIRDMRVIAVKPGIYL